MKDRSLSISWCTYSELIIICEKENLIVTLLLFNIDATYSSTPCSVLGLFLLQHKEIYVFLSNKLIYLNIGIYTYYMCAQTHTRIHNCMYTCMWVYFVLYV